MELATIEPAVTASGRESVGRQLLERERRHGQWLDRDAQQQQRVVVAALRFLEELAAAFALVNQHPLPSPRTVIAMGSIDRKQSDARSPGSSSTCRLHRHSGQWLRCCVPSADVHLLVAVDAAERLRLL